MFLCLKLLKTLGSGLDRYRFFTRSTIEFACWFHTKIIFTPNGVSFEEIEEVAHWRQINIDNRF
jgi:diaminopimelate decarboxylase